MISVLFVGPDVTDSGTFVGSRGVTFVQNFKASSSIINNAAIYNRLKPSGHYMYRQFNIQQFYVLSTQCIYVFYVDLRTNSDYFPMQH